MNTTSLNNKIVSRLKKVEKNLLAYIQDMEGEQLHRLRVEIKKIKAILSFINTTNQEHYNINRLKPLFHKSGEIREIQINVHLLSTLPQTDAKQIIQLEEKGAALCEEFKNMVPLYLKVIKSFRKKVSLPAELAGEKRIRKYFKNKLIKAKRNLQEEDRVSLHLFRTRIKEIIYVRDALPKKMQRLIIINKPYISRLQEKAGDWHDTFAAISWLSDQAFPAMDEVILKLKEKESDEFDDLILLMRKLENEISI